MSKTSGFQAAINAIQGGQFDRAIHTLELLYQQVRPPSKEYYEISLWLVRAYHDGGQTPKAVQLCRQLLTSDHPQVRQWSQQMLTTLQQQANADSHTILERTRAEPGIAPGPNATTLLTAPTQFPPIAAPPNTEIRRLMAEAEANTCLDQGLVALKSQQWSESIASLKHFLSGVPSNHKNYSYAQTALVKAYQGNQQIKAAIAVAHALLKSPHPSSKLWAEQFLLKYEI